LGAEGRGNSAAYLRAGETFARVRELLRSVTVQVNIGQKQVNVAGGDLADLQEGELLRRADEIEDDAEAARGDAAGNGTAQDGQADEAAQG